MFFFENFFLLHMEAVGLKDHNGESLSRVGQILTILSHILWKFYYYFYTNGMYTYEACRGS